jgi:hypothetical protein
MKTRCALVLLWGAACGGDANAPGPDAMQEATWRPLITRGWSLGAGEQGYKCRRIRVDEDMWVGGFRELSPVGTHHAVVSLSRETSVGDFDCTAGSLASENQLLYGAGVRTDDLEFPEGVAVHLRPGDYVSLQLHVFDTGDQPLTGESGVLVKTVPPESVVNEANMTFAGTVDISIPPDNHPHTAQGGCTMQKDTHVLALFPHMHQLGIHQSLVVTHAGTPATLLDVPFEFGEQVNARLPDTLVHAGDRVDVTCTYVNTTSATVQFGDSSTDEMCFTGIYAYPPADGLFGCVN